MNILNAVIEFVANAGNVIPSTVISKVTKVSYWTCNSSFYSLQVGFGEQAGIPYSRCRRITAPYSGMKTDYYQLCATNPPLWRAKKESCQLSNIGRNSALESLFYPVPVSFLHLRNYWPGPCKKRSLCLKDGHTEKRLGISPFRVLFISILFRFHSFTLYIEVTLPSNSCK